MKQHTDLPLAFNLERFTFPHASRQAKTRRIMLLKDEVTLFHQSTVFDGSFFICNCCMTSSSAALWLLRLMGVWSEQLLILPFPWLHPLTPSLPPVSTRAQTHTAGADWEETSSLPKFPFLGSWTWPLSLVLPCLDIAEVTLPCPAAGSLTAADGAGAQSSGEDEKHDHLGVD